jgi:hypothetical protein
MIQLTAHKRRVKTMRPSEIVARQHAVVDAIDRRFSILHNSSSIEN